METSTSTTLRNPLIHVGWKVANPYRVLGKKLIERPQIKNKVFPKYKKVAWGLSPDGCSYDWALSKNVHARWEDPKGIRSLRSVQQYALIRSHIARRSLRWKEGEKKTRCWIAKTSGIMSFASPPANRFTFSFHDLEAGQEVCKRKLFRPENANGKPILLSGASAFWTLAKPCPCTRARTTITATTTTTTARTCTSTTTLSGGSGVVCIPARGVSAGAPIEAALPRSNLDGLYSCHLLACRILCC